MTDAQPALNDRLAARIRELRAARGLSLEALSGISGVSRSTISLIERAETSPTAVVLEKLASGLGLSLPALFEFSGNPSADPVSRRGDQSVWTDPASGYTRRNVSPPGFPQPIRIVEVHFPAGARVAFDNTVGNRVDHQQIWMRQGAMKLTVGDETFTLNPGDCLAMRLDRPTVFHNPTRKPARYVVVIASEAQAHR